ncbi:LysR family transcriptional regulator [bacterium]|nr:LysR family transcriptional regulator [bacterium]
MNYTLQQLRIFERFCRLGSLARCAEAMSLTEAAVSIQLRNFQQEFALPLVEKRGRNLQPTEYGRLIEDTVRRILEEHLRLEDVSQEYRKLEVGSLRLASASTGKYVLPYFLSEFATNYPKIDVRFEVKERNEVIEGLMHFEFDAILLSLVPEIPNLETLDLLPDSVQLIGPASAPHPDRIQHWEDLKSFPLLGRSGLSGVQSIAHQHVLNQGWNPEYRMMLNSYEAVKQSILAGLGMAFMPTVGLRHELAQRELRTIDIPAFPLPFVWKLVWLKDRRKSPALERLILHLTERRRALVEKHFGWLPN